MSRSVHLAAFGLLLAACHEPITLEGSTSSAETETGDTTGPGASGPPLSGTGGATDPGATGPDLSGAGTTGPGSATASSTAGADETDSTEPPLLDVAVVPDAPPPPGPCPFGCPSDAFCSWCPLFGLEECVLFPPECMATPTCECLLDVFEEDDCYADPDGMIIHEPFCEGPMG